MTTFEASFVGFATLDVSGRPVVEIPDGGGIAFLDEIRINPAGTAVGAAMNAAKLGVRSTLVACVGDDEKGRFLTSACESLGLDCSHMQHSSTPTSTTILPIRPNGDRPCLHARGASDDLFIDDQDFDTVCDARFLHYAGHGYIKAMEAEQGARLVAHAKSSGLTTTFDLIGPGDHTVDQLRPVLPHIDYFMPSIEEATFMSGQDEPADAARFFLDLGVGACVFTMGPLGSYVHTADDSFRLPAFEVEVRDTTGCGDSYCGGFIAGLGLGYDLEQACRLATATSALVASGLGSDAGVVDLDATLEFMESAPIIDADDLAG